jgi:ABC-type glycerol-3-phosphate transport system substrate-binding protein
MKRKQLIGLAALLIALAVLAGCVGLVVGAAAGAGAVAYVRGELQAQESAPIGKVLTAAKGAIEDLKLTLISATADDYKGKVRAATAEGTKITIELKHVGKDVTSVHVRVGTLGDETLSRQILDAIEARL